MLKSFCNNWIRIWFDRSRVNSNYILLYIWEGKFTFVTKTFSSNSENLCAHIHQNVYIWLDRKQIAFACILLRQTSILHILSCKRSISTGYIMINLILMYVYKCVRHERETIYSLCDIIISYFVSVLCQEKHSIMR